VLAVTLALLVGIIAVVRAYSASAPVRSDVATTTGASTTGRAPGAPDFTLPTLAGTTFHLAAQQGHPVVLVLRRRRNPRRMMIQVHTALHEERVCVRRKREEQLV